MSSPIWILGVLVLLTAMLETQGGLNKLSKEDRLDCYIKCNQCKLLFTWPKPFSSTNCRQQCTKSKETGDEMFLSGKAFKEWEVCLMSLQARAGRRR